VPAIAVEAAKSVKAERGSAGVFAAEANSSAALHGASARGGLALCPWRFEASNGRHVASSPCGGIESFLLCHLPDVGLAADSLRVGILLIGVNSSQDGNLDLFITAQ
jgi:hypothetical protein